MTLRVGETDPPRIMWQGELTTPSLSMGSRTATYRFVRVNSVELLIERRDVDGMGAERWSEVTIDREACMRALLLKELTPP